MARICLVHSPRTDQRRTALIKEGLKRLGVPASDLVIGGAFPSISLWRFLSVHEGEFDAIMIATDGADSLPLIASVATKMPVVWLPASSAYERIAHDAVVPRRTIRTFLRWAKEWLLASSVDRIILPTRAACDFFVKTFGVPTQKVGTVFLGVDDGEFAPSPTQPSLETTFEVLYDGDFARGDGVDIILHAAKMLEGSGQFRFTIIGRGGEEEHLRDLAKELNVPSVTFLPYVEPGELPHRYTSAHAVLGVFSETPFTAHRVPERFLRGAAVCRPVITAHTSVLDEEFPAEDAFYVVPPKDPAALANAFQVLKNDSLGLARRVNAAYQRYSAIGTPEAVARRLLEAIETVGGS